MWSGTHITPTHTWTNDNLSDKFIDHHTRLHLKRVYAERNCVILVLSGIHIVIYIRKEA